MSLRVTIAGMLLLFAAFSAAADDACPIAGSGDDRIAYLGKQLDEIKAHNDTRKKEQEEMLKLIQAKLKIDGKWSEEIGKAWKANTAASPQWQESTKQIEQLLNEYNAALEAAFLAADKNPAEACSKADAAAAALRAVSAETEKQYTVMTTEMLKFGSAEPSTSR